MIQRARFATKNERVAIRIEEVPEARVGDIMGKGIVLVDDVLTSGATANECARMLKRAGAVHVDVLAFALVSHAG